MNQAHIGRPPATTGRRARFVAAVLVAALLNAPFPARSAPPSEDELNRQGVEARRQGDDAAAREIFHRAYERYRTPRSAAQLGLAEIAVGRWNDAEAHLAESLAAEQDPWIRKHATVLRESLERVRRQFGELEVLGSPTGAEVVVEGKVVGTVPMQRPARIRIGTHRFEVRAPGHVEASRTVEIRFDTPVRETVELAASSGHRLTTSAAPASPGAGAVVTSPDSSVQTAPEPLAEGDEDEEARRSHLRTIGFVLAGGAVIAGAVGLVFGMKAKAAADANSRPGTTFDHDTAKNGQRYETIQYIGYGAAVVLAASSVVTFLMSQRADAGGHGNGVALLPLPSGGALGTWSGTF